MISTPIHICTLQTTANIVKMAYKFNAGQRLIIELDSGDLIEGDFVYSSSSRLDVKNCLNTSTEIKDASIQHFYQSEIVNIKAFEPDEVESEEPKTTTSEVISSPESSRTIKISPQKYHELKVLGQKYIYMATMDARYYEAVNTLLNTETIGTAILSSDFGRAAPVELLVLSTWEQVYIFDISLYNCKHFPSALKYILECEDIVKVIHDSRELIDCMHHQYKIKVNNIFDTFVATQMISEKSMKLYECLSYYFNFPEVLIKEAMDAKLKPDWKERPLSDEMKQYASMNVQYLITVKNYLQKHLLKDFHENVLRHSQSTVEQSNLDAQISLGCLDINK